MHAGRKPLSPETRERGRRLADLLRKQREKHRKTAEDLAVASGVSLEAIRKLERYETAHPGFFTVVDLARALKLDLAKLERGQRKTR